MPLFRKKPQGLVRHVRKVISTQHLIVEAASPLELDRIFEDLPVWPLMETSVTPLLLKTPETGTYSNKNRESASWSSAAQPRTTSF
jgi:hypothetical protein